MAAVINMMLRVIKMPRLVKLINGIPPTFGDTEPPDESPENVSVIFLPLLSVEGEGEGEANKESHPGSTCTHGCQETHKAEEDAH